MKSYMETDFLSGDCGLSRGTGLISKVLIWFQSIWTGLANWSHVYCFVGPNLIVEALDKIRLTEKIKYKDQITSVYRIPLTDEERESFRLTMLRRLNGAYGFLKYPLFVLDSFSTWVMGAFGRKDPVFFFTKTFGITNIPVCSELYVWGIHKATSFRWKDKEGKEVNWRVVNPDYMEDLIKIPVNQAVLVYSSQSDQSQGSEEGVREGASL